MKIFVLFLLFIASFYGCKKNLSPIEIKDAVQYEIGNIYKIKHQYYQVGPETIVLDSTFFEILEIASDTTINGNKYYIFESNINDYKRFKGVSGNLLYYAYTEGQRFIKKDYFDYSRKPGEVFTDDISRYHVTSVRSENVLGEIQKVIMREYDEAGIGSRTEKYATKFGFVSSFFGGRMPMEGKSEELVGAIIGGRVYGEI